MLTLYTSEATEEMLNYDCHLFDSVYQIRLLQLTYSASGQSQGTFATPISVSTDGAGDDGNDVDFAALSYEWGDSEETESMEIDGQILGIRNNLMRFLEALPELRAKQKTLPTRF